MMTSKRCFTAVILIMILGLASLIAAGEILSYPAHRVVGPPPASLNAASVEIHSIAGDVVSGWMIPGRENAGVVLLLHGIRADRRDMEARAKFLSSLGYGVLLIDLPAHGESTGSHITFGAHESEGVRAALSYLAHNHPSERIGVIGVSLGAASMVLANPDPAPSAVVLESMFPTIEEAVTDRLRKYVGAPGEMLAPLLLQQIPLRFDIPLAQLRPIQRIADLHCPVFIISGAIDQNTTLAETERIFAAAVQPKQLWIVNGASHVDLYAFGPKVYEQKVAAFLSKYLQKSG